MLDFHAGELRLVVYSVIRPYLLRKVKYFHFPGVAADLKKTAYLLLEGLLCRIAISV